MRQPARAKWRCHYARAFPMAGAVALVQKLAENEESVPHRLRDGKSCNLEKSMNKKGNQDVVITVAGNCEIHDVARDLKASGLEGAQVLDAIGVVTGSASPNSIAKLRKIHGVQDVSLDHKVDIGPPDAPVS